jgi:membrane protease YdiL (CAAX protease family)
MREVWVIARCELRRFFVDWVGLWLLLGTWALAMAPMFLADLAGVPDPQEASEAKRAEMDAEPYVVSAPPGYEDFVEDEPITWVSEDAETWDAQVVPGDEKIVIRWDRRRKRSDRGSDLARSVVKRRLASDMGDRAREAGLPEDPREVLSVTYDDVEHEESRLAAKVASTGFLMLMLGTLLPVSYMASDVFSGERERGTFELLLVSRVARASVIQGKALAVWMMGCVGGWGILGLALAGRQLDWDGAAAVPGAIRTLALGVVVVPVLSGLLAAVASRAYASVTSYRAASLASIPLVAGAFLLGSASLVPDLKLAGAMWAVPVANLSLLMRDVMRMEVGLGAVAVVGAVSAVQLGLAVWWMSRALQGESALLGAEAKVNRREQGDFSGDAARLAALAIILMWTVGAAAQTLDLVGGLLFSQVVLLAVPAVLVVRTSGLDVRETMSLRRPTLAHVVGGLVLGLSMWSVVAVVMWVQSQWLVDDALTEAMADMLIGDRPLWFNLLLVGALPGICEELFFRGAMMGFSRTGRSMWPAVTLNAALFGLMHADLLRIVPTGVLGLCMAIAVWRSRCLWVGCLAHATHNGMQVAAMQLGGATEVDDPPMWAVAVGLMVLVGVLYGLGHTSDDDLPASR